MPLVRRYLLLSCAFAGLAGTLPAATLLGEFGLRGTLGNNVSGGPALGLLPFAGVPGQVTALGYVFTKNQGLTFASPSLTAASYSIEFSFSSTLDSSNAWSKLLDFSGAGSIDVGLYIHNSGGYRLQFFDRAEGIPGDFTAGGSVDVVLTRDGATNLVTGYVNGQSRFSFTDTLSEAVITAGGNTLTFFVDDLDTSQSEVSGGTANYIRIYSGALTAGEVSALFSAGAPAVIPEPAATTAVLALGSLAALALWRRGLSRKNSVES